MLFVVNIGNTNTQYAVYQNDKLGEIYCCKTSEFQRSLIPVNMPVAVASVVPEINELFCPKKTFFLTSETCPNLNLDCINKSTVGADRLANTIMLLSEKLPAVCIDCGTAITFEVVDKKGHLLGGAIAPGRQLLRNSLNVHTAQLPNVPLSDTLPECVGVNTTEAILLGVDRGVIGAVKEILQCVKKNLDEEANVIAVGGDSSFFVNNIKGLIKGEEGYTLKGIAKAWELKK